jgi:hypothetical protein
VSVCDLCKHLPLIEISLMNIKFHEIKLWIAKKIEILILKGFNIIYVKFMIGEWCDLLVIHRK